MEMSSPSLGGGRREGRGWGMRGVGENVASIVVLLIFMKLVMVYSCMLKMVIDLLLLVS